MQDRPTQAGIIDDLSLLRKAEDGDLSAFETLVLRHQDSVFRFARSLVRYETEAEDVLQQTFLSAWRACTGDTGGRKAGDASVKGWLFAIARHAAYKTHRHRARHPDQPTGEDPLIVLGQKAGWGAEDDPEALASALESRQRLNAALAQLEPSDREIITLRDIEGLSGDEAASVVGLSLAATKSKLHRARLKLRAALREGDNP